MKWNAASLVEHRLFDRRLVKDNLLDKWHHHADIAHGQRSDYRQFLESYPWTTSSTIPPLGQSYHDPSVPVRQSNYYQSIHSHPSTYTPLRAGDPSATAGPSLAGCYDAYTGTSNACHAGPSLAGGTDRPIVFPNLVTNFERSPAQAARHALYTRPTPAEWSSSCINAYNMADVNRQHAERLRNDAVRLMRQTDERTAQGQRDAGFRLGERLTDVTFWRTELQTELERLLAELAQLSDTRRKAARALADLEPPLHVAQECMYHREGRQGIERVHDDVERGLLYEVQRLRTGKDQLTECLRQIDGQLADLRSVQHELQQDLMGKESTLGIDGMCHQMTNGTRGIQYYGGIERYDPTISSVESWAQASARRVNISQSERGKSAQMRSNTDTLINTVATAVWDNWSQSNNALNRRAGELADSKNKVQLHLQRTQQEMFDVERNIEKLQQAIRDKANPLRVAQTRLEARAHRGGMELCRDAPHLRLVDEVRDIQDSIAALQRKLADAEAQHQQLVHTRSELESNLKKKVNALHIDREKCMGLRRSFPVDSLIKY